MSGAARELAVVSSVADRLLSRLDGVERHGSGWRARCPSHGSDKNRTLSVAVADDGRLLIHCFGCCTAQDVVQAVGLELSDLFAARVTHNATPEQRRELRQAARQAQWAAALEVLSFEARVVLVAADQVGQGEPLNEPDSARLRQAVSRVESAKAVLHGR